jgi:hypothetical protein
LEILLGPKKYKHGLSIENFVVCSLVNKRIGLDGRQHSSQAKLRGNKEIFTEKEIAPSKNIKDYKD